jgi:hypothetical protein
MCEQGTNLPGPRGGQEAVARLGSLFFPHRRQEAMLRCVTRDRTNSDDLVHQTGNKLASLYESRAKRVCRALSTGVTLVRVITNTYRRYTVDILYPRRPPSNHIITIRCTHRCIHSSKTRRSTRTLVPHSIDITIYLYTVNQQHHCPGLTSSSSFYSGTFCCNTDGVPTLSPSYLTSLFHYSHSSSCIYGRCFIPRTNPPQTLSQLHPFLTVSSNHYFHHSVASRYVSFIRTNM